MKYRIVIRDVLTKRITPLTIFFETKEYANQRLRESYTSKLPSHSIYDLQSTEESSNETQNRG